MINEKFQEKMNEILKVINNETINKVKKAIDIENNFGANITFEDVIDNSNLSDVDKLQAKLL